ncbi:MAG: 16S rRNA (adenine(1518)-N(6)/adenine(1519)-N(6))-dimethyltransferase RsmA [Candidatus Berkelbacteria bacterium]
MLKPKKQLGQNFLINEEIADRIIEAANLSKEDTVVEVGPGLGVLTSRLSRVAGEVLAIEKDFDLIDKLRRGMGQKNLKLIHQDALWFDLGLLDKYKVVANIPYNITSPLIRKFIEQEPRPELLVLMVQKEVAERICAKPGDSSRGLLTLIVEFYAEAEILFEVNRKEFLPAPKVDSAVIKITPKKSLSKIEPLLFFKIVKAGFSSKRQQIHNALAGTLRLEKDQVQKLLSDSKIDPKRRAEDLALDEWIGLALNYKKLLD